MKKFTHQRIGMSKIQKNQDDMMFERAASADSMDHFQPIRKLQSDQTILQKPKSGLAQRKTVKMMRPATKAKNGILIERIDQSAKKVSLKKPSKTSKN